LRTFDDGRPASKCAVPRRIAERGIVRGDTTSEQLTQHFLQAIRQREPGGDPHRAFGRQAGGKTRGVRGLVFFHVPNGGKRNRIEAARFKGLGVRAGVADLILVHRGNVYALELKSSTGRPTVCQMEFMSEFNAAGGHGYICHDLDRALQTLERWGLLK
jgi:hypothetical protein